MQEIVNKMYVEKLDEDYVGYNNQTIKKILAHLKDNWCLVTTLERRQAAEIFCVQWDETTHITKFARQLNKQQRLCRDIGIPVPDQTKVQYYVKSMYLSEMFNEQENNDGILVGDNKGVADKKIDIAQLKECKH